MATFNSWKDAFANMTPRIVAAIEKTMREGSEDAKRHFIKSFTDGGFTDTSLVKWQPRKRETKKTIGKGVLFKTGTLRRSIRVMTLDKRYFIVVSDMGLATRKDYAPVHNYGRRAGRGAGFIMPKREFMGTSSVLENKIREKLIRNINLCFK